MIPILQKRLLHTTIKLRASIVDETLISISRSNPIYRDAPPPPTIPSTSSSSSSSSSRDESNIPSAILNSPMYKNQQLQYQQQQLQRSQKQQKQQQQQQQQVESNNKLRTKITIPIQSEIEAIESKALTNLLIRLLSQLNSIFPLNSVPNLNQLLKDFNFKNNFVIDEELLYESNPKQDRKIQFNTSTSNSEGGSRKEGNQSGLVTVCYVYGNNTKSIISTCSGFKVCETKDGEGDKIITCAHTLTAMSRHLNSSTPESEQPSAAFILTSSGHIFPVTSLLSSLPSSDILLLQISPEPMRDPNFALMSTVVTTTTSSSNSNSGEVKEVEEEEERRKVVEKRKVPKLNSLPINPYPAKNGSKILNLVFKHPMSQLSTTRNSTSFSGDGGKEGEGEEEEGRRQFDEEGNEFSMGKIIEYQDSEGYVSSTGTYDSLNTMSISNIPKSGSSGSPIIDFESGSVVGIVRGSRFSYGERGERGFGSPAERIYEMFQLPGMGKKFE